MENEERPEQSEPRLLARRGFMTSTIALGALSLPMRIASAGSAAAPIGWVHGSGAVISGAQRPESDAIHGNARVVRGRSWSSLPLHFAIPTASPDTGKRAHWGDLRIPLEAPQRIARSIGVTIRCEFDDIDRRAAISAVGCEFV